MRSAVVLRKLLLALLLLAAVPCAGGAPAFAQEKLHVSKPVEIVLFYGRGCPYCVAMRDYLGTLKARYPQLSVRDYEVYFNGDNARLFERMADAYKFTIEGVPTTFLGDRVYSGYGEDLQPEIEAQIKTCMAQGCASPLARAAGVTARTRTLTLSAVLSGAAVDAINPCAFAVLIILITGILGSGGRQRALYAGLAFSLSIFISYYLMGLGLYSAVEAAGVTHGLYVAVAVLAIIIGLFNLKDYLWYGKWFVMEVPLSWRPRLKQLIGGVTSIPGAFLIGFVVSLFLLPCTSGPYIVILGLLAKTETRAAAMLWLVLYNVIFILPMVAITAAVYFGLTTAQKAESWRTSHLHILHLIAGSVILLLGVGMLVSLWFGYV